MRFISSSLGLVVLLSSGATLAASLPRHDPLDITIVGDEVNPHGLTDAQLTQPADIVAALQAADSGVEISSLVNAESDCVDAGLAALPDTDVLIYFAHRAATYCSGNSAQEDLTDATRALLERGGGVLVFHHGLYAADGKTPILQLLGGVADEIALERSGQRVIAVSSDHFVTTNEVEYTDQTQFTAPSWRVPDGSYPSFTNAPDERYPDTQLFLDGREELELLFVSDYAGPQILGYDLRRPSWSGHVVFFQPGESQPIAVDDRDGNNFQILANAIYYLGTTQDEPADPPGEPPEPPQASTGPSGSESDGTDGGQPFEPPQPDPTSASGTQGAPSADADAGPESREQSGCQVGERHGFWAFVLPMVPFIRRRRARPQRA